MVLINEGNQGILSLTAPAGSRSAVGDGDGEVCSELCEQAGTWGTLKRARSRQNPNMHGQQGQSVDTIKHISLP
jgi:hypothetical protein